ncbi:uncharacterized protein LOC141911131 [Tubulanus polymorphus]|uniref:uncharacterized protein LOC141911131 n=1 Tax=Tubulanus polymorphus TaxID=672921 RepID=UPI003DA50F64
MNVTPRVFFIALCVTLIHVSCSSIRITAPVIEFACDEFSATLTCPVADNSSSVVWHRLVHGNWLPLQVGRLGRNSWKPVVGDMSKISTRSVNTHMAGKYRCSYPSGAIIHEVELRVDVCNGQVGDCTAKPVLGDFENFKNRKIEISRRHGESVAFKCSTLNDWFCLNSDCSQCSSAKADDSSSPSVVSSSFRFK